MSIFSASGLRIEPRAAKANPPIAKSLVTFTGSVTDPVKTSTETVANEKAMIFAVNLLVVVELID